MYTVYPILRTDSTPVVLIKLSCLTQPLPTSSVGSYTDRQVVQYTVYTVLSHSYSKNIH